MQRNRLGCLSGIGIIAALIVILSIASIRAHRRNALPAMKISRTEGTARNAAPVTRPPTWAT